MPLGAVRACLGGWHRLGRCGGTGWHIAGGYYLFPMPDQLTEITRAARGYYAQAARVPITATDFFDWLKQLSPAGRAEFEAQGLAFAQTERAFLRFVLELRGISMLEYMMEHLSVPAFELWAAHAEFNGDLPDRFVRL